MDVFTVEVKRGRVKSGSTQVIFRVDAYHKEIIDRAAQTVKMGQSEFMRSVIVQAAKQILKEHHGTAVVDYEKDYSK